MRIGIDLHTVNDFMQGSRTYIYNVTKALLRMDPVNDYFLYFTENNPELEPEFQQPNVHKNRIFPATRIIRLPLVFPIKLAMQDIDIFHCQYMGPPLSLTPYIVTLHDIIHEVCPEFYPPTLRFLMGTFYPLGARRAARVLTVSEYSKNAIVKIYGVPEGKVEVTYDAVSNEFRIIKDKSMIAAVKNKYHIHGNYILFVGRLEPRKNIPGLIKAFCSLKKHHKISQKLVIVGMKDILYQEIFDTVKHLELNGEVVFTGRVDQEDLPIMYNGADLFVYPSFGEGFGIPPLEAMACGIPVITSNTTSLPEVVGDAGIMVDPHSERQLAKAMYDVLRDCRLQRKMEIRGLKQVKRFSWDRTAEKVLKVYEEVYEESCRRKKDR